MDTSRIDVVANRASLSTRPLRRSDFEAVVALDAQANGRARKQYFEKRLESAIRQPSRHFQIAAVRGERLIAFVLSRVVTGEHGRPEPTASLESIAVEHADQHGGVARLLVTALDELLCHRGITALVTQAAWQNVAMLKFLDGAGFRLAPCVVLERKVEFLDPADHDAEQASLAVNVRQFRSTDFEAVARIDRRITGQDRSEYLRRKIDEVLHDSAIEVSLVAENDSLPVGFVMARVDYGDFGRVEPTASLDTLGVHPGFEHKGFGRAALMQLINNLASLRVERVETEVALDAFGLLGFLHAFGFRPTQRISFERRVPK